jgi:hypothetical protein
MTDIEQHDSVEVFVGVDVGKGTHHAVALVGTRTLSPKPRAACRIRCDRQQHRGTPPSAPGKESVLARALYDPFLQWYGYRTDVVAETLLLWGCCLAFAKLWIDPISSIAIAACSATLLALICQDIRLPDNHEAIKTQHRRQLQIHKQQRIPWRRFVSYVPIKSLPLEVDTRDGGHG